MLNRKLLPRRRPSKRLALLALYHTTCKDTPARKGLQKTRPVSIQLDVQLRIIASPWNQRRTAFSWVLSHPFHFCRIASSMERRFFASAKPRIVREESPVQGCYIVGHAPSKIKGPMGWSDQLVQIWDKSRETMSWSNGQIVSVRFHTFSWELPSLKLTVRPWK